MDSTHSYLLICHVNLNYYVQFKIKKKKKHNTFDKRLTSVLNLCRYGKGTRGIFEEMGIVGSKPVMYFGTLANNRVCILISEVLITLSSKHTKIVI